MEYSGYQYLVREPLPMIASILLFIDAIVLSIKVWSSFLNVSAMRAENCLYVL